MLTIRRVQEAPQFDLLAFSNCLRACWEATLGTMGLSVLDWLLLGFFASHIPITILIDSQAVFPRSVYPQGATDLVDWYAHEFHDPYMEAGRPIQWWFTSFVVCELLFQFPLFFAAVYGIYTEATWIKIPGIIYGAHVSTTVIAIIAEVLFKEFEPTHGPQTLSERLTLTAVYMPYLLFPFLFMVKCIYLDDTPRKLKSQ